jgi:hypothetical protein
VFFFLYVASVAILAVPAIALAITILLLPTAPSTASASHVINLARSTDTQYPAFPNRQGPTAMSKFFLLLASLSQLFFVLPPNIWSHFFAALANNEIDWLVSPSVAGTDVGNSDGAIPKPPGHKTNSSMLDCLGGPLMGVASPLDILQWAQTLGLIFWFMFVRSEFRRSKEGCVIIAVRYVRDTFGFNV